LKEKKVGYVLKTVRETKHPIGVQEQQNQFTRSHKTNFLKNAISSRFASLPAENFQLLTQHKQMNERNNVCSLSSMREKHNNNSSTPRSQHNAMKRMSRSHTRENNVQFQENFGSNSAQRKEPPADGLSSAWMVRTQDSSKRAGALPVAVRHWVSEVS
jgi:hypothetical protein